MYTIIWEVCCITYCDFTCATHEAVHINPLNAELNPICHLLALLGAHLIFHISRIRVNGNDHVP